MGNHRTAPCALQSQPEDGPFSVSAQALSPGADRSGASGATGPGTHDGEGRTVVTICPSVPADCTFWWDIWGRRALTGLASP